MPQLPPLNSLRAFEAAARHLSFKHAAEELNVTDSAISRHISLLEARLGVALFRRLTRQIALTPEGAALFAEVSPALSRIAMAAAAITRRRRAATQISVNAPPTFTMRWLIPRLSDFLRANPGVDVSVTTSIRPVDFAAGGYDLAIRRVPTEISGLINRKILNEMRLPVCHPSLLEKIDSKDPTSLLSQTLLHARTSPGAWSEWLSEVGVKAAPSAQALSFEEMYFVVQAAVNGLGFAIVPAAVVIDEVLSGQLVLPFRFASGRANHYHAIFPRTPGRQGAVERFCDWMAEQGAISEKHVRQQLGLRAAFMDRIS